MFNCIPQQKDFEWVPSKCGMRIRAEGKITKTFCYLCVTSTLSSAQNSSTDVDGIRNQIERLVNIEINCIPRLQPLLSLFVVLRFTIQLCLVCIILTSFTRYKARSCHPRQISLWYRETQDSGVTLVTAWPASTVLISLKSAGSTKKSSGELIAFPTLLYVSF